MRRQDPNIDESCGSHASIGRISPRHDTRKFVRITLLADNLQPYLTKHTLTGRHLSNLAPKNKNLSLWQNIQGKRRL
ncbi:hypothetical protein ScPMuIL_003241 [Solemya velum]